MVPMTHSGEKGNLVLIQNHLGFWDMTHGSTRV